MGSDSPGHLEEKGCVVIYQARTAQGYFMGKMRSSFPDKTGANEGQEAL